MAKKDKKKALIKLLHKQLERLDKAGRKAQHQIDISMSDFHIACEEIVEIVEQMIEEFSAPPPMTAAKEKDMLKEEIRLQKERDKAAKAAEKATKKALKAAKKKKAA